MKPLDEQASAAREELVARAIDLIEKGGLLALEGFYEAHPMEAEAVRSRIAWLIEAGLVQAAPPMPEGVPERLGDFRLIEPIGQGGMGVVYRAEQLSLGREVALKLVRPEQLYFPGALQRFRHEVLTIAGLAHPGIVPIHAVGEEQGVPFFAMERVRGASLGAILAHFAGQEPGSLAGTDLLAALAELGADPEEEASALFEGDWPSVCTRIAREVAEALEHAHRRGVLHRDVKPSNVMLTRGGRVLLLDFGLASSKSAADPRTRTGHRVGTLAYMPPEQLRGERELDVRADIYALGVTLHELLVLRVPHERTRSSRTPAQVEHLPPPQLRTLDARISWELETVVQTALEPDPARRYASAAELASDLACVLAKRPIAARRSGRLLLVRRWVQRHPAASIALVAALAGPSLLAWQQHEARLVIEARNSEIAATNAALAGALSDAERERAAAESARESAERHAERSYAAIESMLGRVGGEVLEDVPRMEPIRRELLADALRLLEELQAEPETGPGGRLQLAHTLHRTAAIQAELGDGASALAALEREAGVLDELLAADSERSLIVDRAELDRRRALLLRLRAELEPARTAAEAAIARLEPLEHDTAGDTRLAWVLYLARSELAQVLLRAGDADASRALLLDAGDALEESGALDAGSWEERRLLSSGLDLLGGTPQAFVEGQARDYDPKQALPYLEQALVLRRELEQERPGYPPIQRDLAETLLHVGVTQLSLGEFEEGYGHLREAYALYDSLATAFAARPVYAEGRAATALDLAIASEGSGRLDERESWLERAVDGFERLHEAEPGNPSHALKLCFSVAHLGHAALGHGAPLDPERAALLLDRALGLGRPLFGRSPDEASLRPVLLWACSLLGSAHYQRGDAEALAATAELALELGPRPIDLVYAARHLVQAAELGASSESALPEEQRSAWRGQALELLERATLRGADAEMRSEIVDPAFLPVVSEARYRAVLDRLGLKPPSH